MVNKKLRFSNPLIFISLLFLFIFMPVGPGFLTMRVSMADDAKAPPQAVVSEQQPAPQGLPQTDEAVKGAAGEAKKQAGEAQKTANAAEEPAADAESAGDEAEEEEEQPELEAGNITVNFKGADIRTVFSYLSEASGVDIVPAPEVKGTVDLKLTNKPWKTALDVVVRNYGLAYDQDGDIIRVITADKLKQEELTTQAFCLNYAKAKDVVTSVKDIVTDRGKVVYDDRTNTIVVTEIPTKVYNIGKIIERLDKRTEQVLIEARVIETLLKDDEKLGIDWNVKFSVSGAKRPTTVPFEAFKTPFNTKSGEGQAYFPQILTSSPTSVTESAGGQTTSQSAGEFPSTATGIFSFPFATKDQFTFGTIDFTEFKAILELLKARSDTEIISNPRIATLNNMEALINIGQTLNLPKYERNSTTGKMEITGYEAKDLGIILKVTPHINDRNEIVIDLQPQISDLLRYDTLDKASGVVAPVFSIRQAKTQVMVRDGDTIFIGGLIKENDVNVKRKLPFIGDLLGDVPYLGLLFTKKETVKEKTELIFFITVNLMTIGKDIKDVPKANKAYIPLYTLTQKGDVNPKKRLNKR